MQFFFDIAKCHICSFKIATNRSIYILPLVDVYDFQSQL